MNLPTLNRSSRWAGRADKSRLCDTSKLVVSRFGAGITRKPQPNNATKTIYQRQIELPVRAGRTDKSRPYIEIGGRVFPSPSFTSLGEVGAQPYQCGISIRVS
jgi:hypothetical protein